ncbi:hypothetical protein [Ferrimonas sp. YFM]|uniref:hypothetical protein n=1 Tax=Ferrimonas sp. YFM TaxID=3028878 RepID=UPI002573D458|nr:hypothetical protein [Ferrimonas sp. YFM]
MEKLSKAEMQSVTGGFVALYWVGVGAVHLYRASSIVRVFSQSFAAGFGTEFFKSAIGED